MDSASAAALKPSALDLLAALLTGREDPEGGAHWAENRHLLLLLTTSLAVLVGCGVALLVRRSSAPRAAAAAASQAPPRSLAAKPKDEPDPDDGRPRVTVFFGTQTGTAEGFAKVPTQTLLAVFMVPPFYRLQPELDALLLFATLDKIGFDGTLGVDM
jgi:NADPH-ferrihemoprotein reductase